MDIATIGLEVKSDGVGLASQRLETLEKSSTKAATATEKLRQSFTGANTATGKLQRELKEMSGEASGGATATGKLKSELLQMSSTGQAATSAMGKLADSFMNLAKYAASFLAAAKLFDLGKGAALAAARYETLGIVMLTAGQNAGYSADQMYKFEQALQKQGISMTEARHVVQP